MVGFVNIAANKIDHSKKEIRNSSFDHCENLSGVNVLLCEDDLRSGSSFIAVREYL